MRYSKSNLTYFKNEASREDKVNLFTKVYNIFYLG